MFLVFCSDRVKSFLWFWRGISVGKKRSNVIMYVCVCVHRHIKREPLDICSTLCFWCIWKKEHENLFYAELPVLKLSDLFLKAWHFCSSDTHGEGRVTFMDFLISVVGQVPMVILFSTCIFFLCSVSLFFGPCQVALYVLLLQ